MFIYIDESGSFVCAESLSKWNVVGALVVPEKLRKKLYFILDKLKLNTGASRKSEIKLNSINEKIFIEFLKDLLDLDVLLFATATDAGLNNIDKIKYHQKMCFSKIMENYDRMIYEGGKLAVSNLAKLIDRLSPQLYVQLQCQINLMLEVLRKSTLYYVQRIPETLIDFRWRIDEKNSKSPLFENSLIRYSPVILQTLALDKPLIMLKGMNYSAMDKFLYPIGEEPRYLSEHYNVIQPNTSAFNLGKMLIGNLQFVDSKNSEGVQIIDILVSGIRRCLRGEFNNNEIIARMLGKLMLENEKGSNSIHLLTFGDLAHPNTYVSNIIKIMDQNSKNMFT